MPPGKWPRRGLGRENPPRGNSKGATILGIAVFFLLLFWALWHGVIGPRVIEPVPADQLPGAETAEN